MSPRPILKRSVSTAKHTHGVHFPPSPALTRTFTVHSSATYDRSPIIVDHNSCALPERGCPGRTYLLDEQRRLDYHPRALSFASTSTYAPVPPLVPDLSSESEESDGFSCLPSDDQVASFAVHAFLPHSPSPKSHHYHNQQHQQPDSTDDDAQHAFQPRRKRTERKHESSRDPDRIPHSPVHASDKFGLGCSPPPTTTSTTSSSSSRSPTRKKGIRPQRAPLFPPSTTFGAGFGAPDDGCLGGF